MLWNKCISCRKSTFSYKMSAVVRRALPLLKVLVDARPKLKKAIIKHAPTELVTAISEIVLNLIKGVIKLTAHQKKRLSRYKKELLALAKKKVSLGKKGKSLFRKAVLQLFQYWYPSRFHYYRQN